MPCELEVASLSAPRPASMGLSLILVLGILATGLRQVLPVERAAFEIPLAVPPPLSCLGGSIPWVAPAESPTPRGCSASRWRFPRDVAGANVVVTFDVTLLGAAGTGQEYSHPAGDLQASVLATWAESLLYVRGGIRNVLTS